MFLKKLSVLNYKNIRMRELTFSPYINCFIGNNGVGKTNLLDTIYHLGMGKSYFNTLAVQNITHGQDFYLLEGVFSRQQREENIMCSVKKGQKKQIKRNGKTYERIADHIGNFPMVIVSPADRDLVTEGSEERRRFLDGVISLTNTSYLSTLINYNKILVQRNSLLKYFAENQTFDTNALHVYNDQLSWFGEEIYVQRKTFLDNFLPIFQEQYEIISGGKEKVSITYQTSLSKHRLADLLLQNQTKDCAIQYTTCGIHKDDLLFEIEGGLVKKFASQGQQKSFLIALKLAQFHIIRQKTDIIPILLLDDIFDKLDTHRVEQLIKLVSEKKFGQIFLTDTHLERTEQIVKQIFKEYQIVEF